MHLLGQPSFKKAEKPSKKDNITRPSNSSPKPPNNSLTGASSILSSPVPCALTAILPQPLPDTSMPPQRPSPAILVSTSLPASSGKALGKTKRHFLTTKKPSNSAIMPPPHASVLPASYSAKTSPNKPSPAYGPCSKGDSAHHKLTFCWPRPTP